MEQLRVRGAREHNLRNVDLDLPRDALIVFTGLSGSGKSSLAFDTIFAEGQRRYVESLSSYARQFLGQMDKPDVDFIEGLSPAVSIDQKSTSRNPRSTVGTITEIYDYLRLLFARIGKPHCPICGEPVTKQTPQQIVDRVLEMPENTRFQVLAPVVQERKGEYLDLFSSLSAQGYSRVKVDGVVSLITEVKALRKQEKHSIDVVVDRLTAKDSSRQRITDSVETALRLADGVVVLDFLDGVDDGPAPIRRPAATARRWPARTTTRSPSTSWSRGRSRSTRRSAPARSVPGSAPRRRSTRSWSCPTRSSRCGRARSIPGAVAPPASTSAGSSRVWRTHSASPWTPRGTGCRSDAQDAVMNGIGQQVHVTYKNRYGRQRSYYAEYEGVVSFLERRMASTESDFAREKYEGYMREVSCPVCGGTRLRPEIRAVTLLVDAEGSAAHPLSRCRSPTSRRCRSATRRSSSRG